MACNNCGGSTGWVLVEKEKLEEFKKTLEKCGLCGTYDYCPRCADVRAYCHGYDRHPPPETGWIPYELIHVALRWCGE